MNKLNKIIALALLTISINTYAEECAPLAGEFTIGKSEESDFTTMTEAFNALQCGGVEGPVTFYIENGMYMERASLSAIEGACAANPILFTSQSGVSADVIMRYTTSDATLVLVGASYVSFVNMTVDHTTATYGNCMRVDGAASHLSFRGVVFNGVEMPRTGAVNAVVYFTSAASKSNIAFEGCKINYGSVGIHKEGVSVSETDSKTSITKTAFLNQNEGGIAMSNEDAPVITDNTIQTVSTYKNFTALHLANVCNQMMVAKNVITAEGSAIGLLLHNCVAQSGTQGHIQNNSITIGGSREAYGMVISGSTNYQSIDFNRIKLSVNAADASLQAFCKNTASGSDVYMENSIFIDLNKGAYTVFGNSYTGSPSAPNASDLSAWAEVR